MCRPAFPSLYISPGCKLCLTSKNYCAVVGESRGAGNSDATVARHVDSTCSEKHERVHGIGGWHAERGGVTHLRTRVLFVFERSLQAGASSALHGAHWLVQQMTQLLLAGTLWARRIIAPQVCRSHGMLRAGSSSVRSSRECTDIVQQLPAAAARPRGELKGRGTLE